MIMTRITKTLRPSNVDQYNFLATHVRENGAFFHHSGIARYSLR